MKFLAILRDSFQETRDRKSFLFMMAFSAILILFSAGISFAPLDERTAAAAILGSFNLVARTADLAHPWAKRHEAVTFEILDFHKLEKEGKPSYLIKLKASPPSETNRLIRHWDAAVRGKCRSAADPIPDADVPVGASLQAKFLRNRFAQATVPDVEIETEGNWTWSVALAGAGSHSLAGAEEMKFLFGAFSWRPRFPGPVPSSSRYMSSAEVMFWVYHIMSDTMAGFVGLLIAVIATAGAVPNMLQKGTLDLLLAKPLERSALLTAKFLGGCSQILLTSAFLVGGCWLALSLRTGYWNLYVPLTALNLTFFFAVLYSVTVLFGVLSRSMALSALATIGTWFLCWAMSQLRVILSPALGLDVPPALEKGVRFLHLLLPKTSELGVINARLLAKGDLGKPPPEMMIDLVSQTSIGTIFLTSSLFALVMISLACLRFSKKDY